MWSISRIKSLSSQISKEQQEQVPGLWKWEEIQIQIINTKDLAESLQDQLDTRDL
jgi:hypothetical protein